MLKRLLFYRKNRLLIAIMDFFILFLFCLPVALSKLKRKNKSTDFQRILILELWGIGDLVMMSTILGPLKDRYPYSEITLLSKAYGKKLFGESGYICEFSEFDFPWTRFKGKYKLWNWDWKGILVTIMRLRRQKFDLVLDARGDIRNNVLSFLIGGKRRIGYDWTGGGLFLTDVLYKSYKSKHRVDAWLNILAHLGIKVEKPHFYIHVPDEDLQWADSFLSEHATEGRHLVIGIHPGAGVKTRCWPIDRFAKFGEYVRDTYNARAIVFIEPEGYGEDFPMQREFIRAKVSLQEMVALIKKVDILLCNDSAAMHIATVVDTPVVAIFGPGDVKRIGPYKNTEVSIIRKDFACSPCFDNCKYDRAMCLDAIETEEVMKVFDSIVRNHLKQRVSVH